MGEEIKEPDCQDVGRDTPPTHVNLSLPYTHPYTHTRLSLPYTCTSLTHLHTLPLSILHPYSFFTFFTLHASTHLLTLPSEIET